MSTSTMTRSIRTLAVLALFIAPVLAHAASIPPGGPNSAAETRRQLSAYFANIQENSPTVLGGLAKSPDVMAAIQKKIAGMSDAELARYQKLMAVAPDWKVAPEAVAKAFPPEVMNHVRRMGAEFASETPEGKEMRNDVRTLVAVLKLMPDQKLQELGLDREMVASLNATFNEMTPLQAAMMHRQAATAGPWNATSAAAMQALPPALQRGAAALADHGPLTDRDIAELGSFRKEIVGLLERIDKLPPEQRESLQTAALRDQMKQLSNASPDVTYMIRHNVPAEMLTALGENVTFMEKIANLSDTDKKGLEQFRSELTTAFAPLDEAAPPADGQSIADVMAGLDPQHLALLKQGMSGFSEWQTALPAMYRAMAAPDVRERMSKLGGPSPDLNALSELESFRTTVLAGLSNSMDGVDPMMLERARKGLAAAPAPRLELMRAALNSLPADATPRQRLGVVSLAGPEINFNCSIDFPSPLPDLSLDFLCNPIEDMLEVVRDGVVNTVNSIVNTVKSALESTINTVKSALDSAINAVTSVVNSIVSGLTNIVNQISNFIQTIPTLAWNAIKAGFELLLSIEIKNGVTVRDLVGRGVEHALVSMKTLLGLAEGWWTAVSNFTLPLIPCPPAGFHTPFGTVGDSAATDNYGRYKLVIDGIIEMIPDTEVSLFIKIPAQILYMAFDFLGICLTHAAENADDALAASRHDLILTNFGALNTYIGTQVNGLAATQGNQTTQILNLVNTQSTNVRSAVSNQSLAIQAIINTENDTIQTVTNREADEIIALIRSESDAMQLDIKDFQALSLRLFIERTLRAGNNHEIAHLQLLEPLGHLRLVSDVVREEINSTKAANQPVGEAEAFYAKGTTAMNAGKEKEAFQQFQKAYQAAASKTGSGTN